MTTIQKRLDKLKPYFKGLKLAEKYRVVEVNLRNTWIVQENNTIEVQQKRNDNTNTMYSMFYSETKSFDDILDYIENDVINHNLEIEEKERLLRSKVEELKRVFENKDLDELNKLKFTTEENSLKLGSNNKKEKQKQNGTTKELSTESQPS
jgi:hypothetical protein